jgi:hypothetical protein
MNVFCFFVEEKSKTTLTWRKENERNERNAKNLARLSTLKELRHPASALLFIKAI